MRIAFLDLSKAYTCRLPALNRLRPRLSGRLAPQPQWLSEALACLQDGQNWAGLRLDYRFACWTEVQL